MYNGLIYELNPFNPNIGVFKGDATDLSNIKTSSQSRAIIENPKKYNALNPEVIRVAELF